MEYIRAAPFQSAENLFLHAAANSKATDVMKMLEDGEVKVDARNVNGSTALHLSASNQYSNIVKILLHFHANPDAAEHDFAGKKTALHIAAGKNNYDICKLLLEHGADPNLKDCNGSSALHIAAKGGFADIVELIRNFGGDANSRDANGYNASYWADQAGHTKVTSILPKPLRITTGDYSAYREQYLRVHDIVDRRKLKKKKGGPKKK